MKTITILDLETTGLDPSNDVPVEIAWCTYSIEHRAVIEARSMLVDEGVRANSAEAEKVHGIPYPLIREFGTSWEHASYECTGRALDGPITGWNVEFDRSFFNADRAGGAWFDAMDLDYPRPSTSRSLVAVALAHDIAVMDAHRALSDVLLLARLFRRVQEMGADLPALIARAMRPKVLLMVADTGFDPKRNEAAKAAGFRWNADGKRWERRMAREDVGAFPFAVRECGQ